MDIHSKCALIWPKHLFFQMKNGGGLPKNSWGVSSSSHAVWPCVSQIYLIPQFLFQLKPRTQLKATMQNSVARNVQIHSNPADASGTKSVTSAPTLRNTSREGSPSPRFNSSTVPGEKILDEVYSDVSEGGTSIVNAAAPTTPLVTAAQVPPTSCEAPGIERIQTISDEQHEDVMRTKSNQPHC